MKALIVLGCIMTTQLAMLVSLRGLAAETARIRHDLDELVGRECVQILLQTSDGETHDVTPHRELDDAGAPKDTTTIL